MSNELVFKGTNKMSFIPLFSLSGIIFLEKYVIGCLDLVHAIDRYPYATSSRGPRRRL